MAEQDQINSYSLLARVISESIDPKLSDFYENHIKGTQMEIWFYNAMNGGSDSDFNWFETKKEEINFKKEASFVNILYWILEKTLLVDSSPRYWQAKFFESKRNKKNYLYQVIKEEYTGSQKVKNPMYLNSTCDHYFALMRIDNTLKKYNTRQEYIDELYEAITAWKKNIESFLFEFKFFDSFDAKRKASYFENDLCEHVFRTINEDFYGNINGVLTSTPKDIGNVFTYRKENIDLNQLDMAEGNLYAKTSSTIDENGAKIIQDTFYRLNTDNDFDRNTKKFDIIENFKKQNPDTKIKTLSTDESDVLANVYSSFDASVISEGFIIFNGKSFVRRVLGKKSIKVRDSRKVLSSIDKLSSVNINVTRRSKNGTLESVSSLSFFDYTIGKDNTSGSNVSASIGERTSIDDIPDELLSGDDWTIRIDPSNFLRQSWMSNTNMEIYTKMYHQIESTQAKSYMLFLQNERINEQITGNYSPYDSIRKFFSFAYLKNKVRIEKERPAVVKKLICEQLKILKDEKIVISNYDVVDTGVYIDFMPFTELEIDLYKIRRPNNARIHSTL